MNEFIEKLIGRLEEEKKTAYNTYDCFRMKVDLGRVFGMEKAIEIVNQLAEEYKHCALCYLGSPCEYQNENAMMPNELLADKNGWIPCSERLPCKEQKVIACINPSIAKHEIILIPYESWNICWHDGSIIAWQPLPEPYTQKGDIHGTE